MTHGRHVYGCIHLCSEHGRRDLSTERQLMQHTNVKTHIGDVSTQWLCHSGMRVVTFFPDLALPTPCYVLKDQLH